MILVLLSADRYQWSLMTQQVQNVQPWMLFWQLPLLAKCIALDVHVYYAAVLNLVYGWRNASQSTAKSSDNIYSNLSLFISIYLQAYNAMLFKWLKLFNKSMYLSTRHGYTLEWILHTLFISKSIKITACKFKTEGTQTGLLNADDCDKWITNTVQPLSMYILYLGANEHTPWSYPPPLPLTVYKGLALWSYSIWGMMLWIPAIGSNVNLSFQDFNGKLLTDNFISSKKKKKTFF